MDGLTQDFLHFEKERALFERNYCGFPYWQGMRIKIRMVITGLEDIYKLPEITISETKRKKGRYFPLCKGYLKDVWNYFHLKKCDILYFDQGLEGAYRNVDGEIKDVYFEYFEYEDKYQVERCYYIKGNKRNPQKPGIGVDLLLPYKLKMKIQSLLKPQNKIDPEEDEFLHSLCDDINKKYDKNISADAVIQEIQYNCDIHKIYEKYYRKILRRTRPDVIILQCHYSETLYPLYKIAKEFSVPVIELQHGHVCNHLAYNYFDTSNMGKELPDYLFTYGDFWNKQIRLPIGTKIISIGNPFLESMRTKYNEMAYEKGIVFYSGKFSSDGRDLEKLAVNFCKKHRNEGYKIYFKFHPGEASVWKDKYLLLADCEDIEIIEPNMNIYRLFSLAKHHISVMSTVLYEAVCFDVCRYIYNFEGIKEFMVEICAPLMESGCAQKFSTIQELEDLINEKENTEFDVVEEMWKSGAKENGQKAVKEIIENNNQRGK